MNVGRTWVVVALLLGCGEPDATSHSYTLLITQTAIAGLNGAGTRGLNLDGRMSDSTDEATCYQVDEIDPIDGEAGVDNALGQALDVTLISERPQPFDPPVALDLEVRGSVDLAATDRIVLSLDEVGLPPAEVIEGSFRTHAPGDATLTVAFPMPDGSAIPLALVGVAVKGRITTDGELTDLVVAGKFDIDDTIAAVTEAAPDIDEGLLRATYEGVADFDRDPDGECQSVSVAFLAEVSD